jgi:Zn2+/Cd2+-exporting ATPase
VARKTLQLPLHMPSGPGCERCIGRLQSALTALKGVHQADIDSRRATIQIEYDPDLIALSRIEEQAREIGADIAATLDHETILLQDLDCPDCASSIEKAVGKMPGVLWAGANFAAAQMHVEFERGVANIADICKVVDAHGVRACRVSSSPGASAEAGISKGGLFPWLAENRRIGSLLAMGILFALALLAVPPLRTWLYAASLAVGGWSTARSGWMSLRTRALDMNVLMTLAVIGAAAIGDWHEALAVVALYNVGNVLQAGAMERTRRSIRGLMTLAPRTARVLRGGLEVDLPVEEVLVGDTVLVRPGERIPTDADIITGASAVNQAPITGESLPAEKGPGDAVFAGTLNGNGVLTIRSTRAFRDTTLSRIIHRVEEAQAQRAPTQQLIDRFARVYTPIVVVMAALVAILPPAYFAAVGGLTAGTWSEWFMRGLSLLIIACPCALVISTPVAIVTAIGNASRKGALIKGGAFLEELCRLRVILYDKTGTLTTGRFRVVQVTPLGNSDADAILRIATALEANSEHPLASAFTGSCGHGCCHERPDVEEFEALSGLGVRGLIDGEPYLLGNPRLMEQQGVVLDRAREPIERAELAGRTAIVLASSRAVLAVIVLSDEPRADAPQTVKDLTGLGILRQSIVTGDNARAAAAAAEASGVEAWQAGLLPEEKQDLVRRYQAEVGPVGMVGDGINDAPALAAANVGIVMGAAGSDTAIETADVALMSDDLTRLPTLVRLSRRTQAVIKQNIAFSLATKLGLVVAAVTVGLPLWLAVVGDVGVSLLVTLNALRLRTA